MTQLILEWLPCGSGYGVESSTVVGLVVSLVRGNANTKERLIVKLGPLGQGHSVAGSASSLLLYFSERLEAKTIDFLKF